MPISSHVALSRECELYFDQKPPVNRISTGCSLSLLLAAGVFTVHTEEIFSKNKRLNKEHFESDANRKKLL